MPSLLVPSIRLNGVDYTIPKRADGTPLPIVFRQLAAFPAAQLQHGQHQGSDYGLIQRVVLTGPLSIGQKIGNDPTRCYDQYNVSAQWPGFIARGPQAQTPTQTAIASGYTVTRGAGFFVANGYLILHGDIASGTTAEPLLYFVGSTTTWTDCTLNADLTADVENIVGVTFGEGYWWVVADQLQTDGANTRITYKAVGTTPTPTVWERANTNGANETLGTAPFTPDRLRFLEYAPSTRMSPAAARLYSISYAAASNRCMLTMRATTDGVNWDEGAAQEMQSTSTPRGLKVMPGADNIPEVIAATNIALYRGNLAGGAQYVEELYRLTAPGGAYSGIMEVEPDGDLFFLDGTEMKHLRWDNNGRAVIDVGLTPQVPIEAEGDFTAIAASQERPWLYLAKGGLAASRNARIYLVDHRKFQTDPEHAWFCIYRHGTAQRAITAIKESRADDGTTRLHFMVESAAGGDQDARYMASITINPLELSTYPYGQTGTVVDSDRDMGFGGLVNKGYLAIQMFARDMSTVKEFTIRDGQNGATPGGGQDIDSASSPAQVWPDKTDGTAGVGVEAKSQQIEVDIKDSAANSTAGPTWSGLAITYRIPPQRADGTIPLEYDIPISLDEKLFPSLGGLSQAITNLYARASAGALTTLRIGQRDTTVEVFISERQGTPQIPGVTVNTQPELPGVMYIRCREVL